MSTLVPTRPPLSFADVKEMADVLFNGGITGGASTAKHIAARIVAGHAFGLNPMASVQNIMVTNGRPVIWGDAMLAMVRASGLLASISEEVVGDDAGMVATVTAKRHDDDSPPTVRTFSAADAKKAGLWGKAGPWQQYPKRMLLIRARSFALRDLFPDVLAGLGCAEEVADAEVLAVRPSAPAALPAGPFPPLGVAPVAALPPAKPGKVSPEVIAEIVAERAKWLTLLEIDPADKDAIAREWGSKLAGYGVTTATDLTPERAADLLRDLRQSPTFDVKKLEAEQAEVFGPAADPEPYPTPAT